MSEISLTNITKSFAGVQVLHGVDLQIESGEFIVFVGPSGCGKSTLLRMISGLENISSGTLKIGGNVVNKASPSERGIAMVFQSYALYPHMSVFDNIAFGLKLKGKGKASTIADKVMDVARTLQIENLLERLPKQLSGGQRQRVAIGRAIARSPRVFLFDEPLSNLDAALRVQTRIEISKLHEDLDSTTMIYVTHDQVEAMTLADRIVVLNKGSVEQIGTPMEIYRTPANLFVAQFMGSPSMNIVPCKFQVKGDMVDLEPLNGIGTVIKKSSTASITGEGSLGFRPEHLSVDVQGQPLFEGEVFLVEVLGESQLVYVKCSNSDKPIVAKIDPDRTIKKGDQVTLSVPPDKLVIFDQQGVAAY